MIVSICLSIFCEQLINFRTQSVLLFSYIYPKNSLKENKSAFVHLLILKSNKMDNLLIFERLDRIERLLTVSKEVLTFEETCDYTGISRSYLYKLTASGNIPHSKPNGKMIFFEKKKLNEWLLQNGRKSNDEIEAGAIAYNFRNKRR